MKIHFIGIGGIGMSALAQLCLKLGHEVSGSNLGRTPIFEILEKTSIKNLYESHNKDFLPEDCNLAIYSEAIPVENEERQNARTLQIEEISYFKGLGRFLQDHCTIAITGTHGKTTTTGILSAAMIAADLDPCVIVGAKLQNLQGSNFRFNKKKIKKGIKPWVIAEACEYRNNFQYLSPEIILLTNIELDHVDFYKNEDQYLETFNDFCQKSKIIIYHQNDKLSQKVLKNFNGQKIAINNDAWVNDIKLKMSGDHNRQNAALVKKLGEFLSKEKNLDFDLDKFNEGLSSFSGAWRRQEVIGTIETKKQAQITVYDDYGHHPTEIKATLQALKEKHPQAKISLVFEPHQFSRTAQFFDDFVKSFNSADHIGLFPIYEARDTEAAKKSISLDDFVNTNNSIKKIETFNDVTEFISPLEQNDVLVFMGAGKISEFARNFIKEFSPEK